MNIQPGWEPLVVAVLILVAACGVALAAGLGLIAAAVARRRGGEVGSWFWRTFFLVVIVEVVAVAVLIVGPQHRRQQFGTTYREGQVLAVSVDTPARTITVTVKDESHDCADIPSAQIGSDGDTIRILASLATAQVHDPPCPPTENRIELHTNTELGTRPIVVEGRGDDVVLEPNPDGSYDPYTR